MPSATNHELTSDEVASQIEAIKPIIGAGTNAVDENEMLEIGEMMLHYMNQWDMLDSDVRNEVNILYYLWDTKRVDGLVSDALEELSTTIALKQILLRE
ncbi:hypothetical protein GQ602_003378 [Ophiocordyceps camponoti-floridani]|uniref:Uncharacterized protein n=1 Tax=Ophiocordyceps camponoti-floridani TaxID=2030778 RepID=A0A8H4Q7Y1_9HYPO|nr:hypothetical protein GQ602_003378 [Ophiocordyceps camponoti-floridani]